MSPVDGERMADPADVSEILTTDGRQSIAASHIARGAMRLFANMGFASVCEVPLPNGRRADVVGLSPKGDLWIAEIKSSVVDFQTDQKWPEYWECCDRLYFAVSPDFPLDLLPATTGIIVADRFGGEIIRPVADIRLPSHRRRAMTLRFAGIAAARLHSLADPGFPLDQLIRGE